MASVLIQGVTRKHIEVHLPGLLPDFDKGIRSFLSIPLAHHDRPVGVLQIFSMQDSAYSERHVRLAERVGSQVAGAVANSLLHAELQWQSVEVEERVVERTAELQSLVHQQHTLAEIGRIITSSSSIEEVYAQCAEKICELIPSEPVAVNLVSNADHTVLNAYVTGGNVPSTCGVKVPLEGTFTALVCR